MECNLGRRTGIDFLRPARLLLATLFAFGIVFPAFGQSKRFRPAPDYVQIGTPDQAEGRRIIQEFRARGLYPSNEYIEFELQLLPRRGPERMVPGRMWVGRDGGGPVTRFSLNPGVEGKEEHLLVQGGANGAIWRWKSDAGSEPQKLAASTLFDRLADTDVTAFELQLSFLFWTEFVFEGVSKVRGRPAHVFLMYPPSEVAARKPEMSGVRVYLDTQYNAPVQFEELNSSGNPAKSVSVIDLKKIGDQWLPKAIDFRDEATRNKSRFSVTAAAKDVEFASSLFDPSTLSQSLASPSKGEVEKLGP